MEKAKRKTDAAGNAMEQLIHAYILIGELLSFIAVDNLDVDDHWVHNYQDVYRMLVEFGARNYPEMSIRDHLHWAFNPKSTMDAYVDELLAPYNGERPALEGWLAGEWDRRHGVTPTRSSTPAATPQPATKPAAADPAASPAESIPERT